MIAFLNMNQQGNSDRPSSSQKMIAIPEKLTLPK
jgi:hypothetical protein